jgi:hypothetical protein
MAGISSGYIRQTRGRNGLAMAFVFFVGNVKSDLGGQFRELRAQTSFAPAKIMSPPSPDVTRPRISTWRKS